jgi:ABC-2 type transport system permease protein
MKKIFLIIEREYLTRVRKKAFIITTLLLPLLYLLLIFGTGYISAKSKPSLRIAVADQSGYFTAADFALSNTSELKFDLWNDTARIATAFDKKGYNGFVAIGPFDWQKGFNAEVKMNETRGESTNQGITFRLTQIWEKIKNRKSGLDEKTVSTIQQSQVKVSTTNINDATANGRVAGIIGQISGFLIYLILLIYGSQVMMGVMEEKTNRIAEVVISSVKPFQLMMGKIIGIGLVAITQFLLWVGLIVVIYNIAKIGGKTDSSAIGGMVGGMQKALSGINLPVILIFFLLYFIGGFFFYASLYAAIGSAVNEDIRDAQSLSFPVTMLVIFSIVMMIPVSDNPSSPMAVWGSMLPFSSPIVMMARIPYGVPATVPWWQLLLSLFILYASIAVVAWVSARIYRTGILMYGKKVTLKEMFKWVTKKQ